MVSITIHFVNPLQRVIAVVVVIHFLFIHDHLTIFFFMIAHRRLFSYRRTLEEFIALDG